jgi:hypothetical protein
MRSCPECNAALSDREGRCPRCGCCPAAGALWKVVFKSPESLRRHFDLYLVHHGLVAPRSEPVERETLVQLRLVLPEDGGELWLTGRVLDTVEQPERARAPYDVRLELLDLDADKEETLRRVASGGDPAGTSPPQGVVVPPSETLTIPTPEPPGPSSIPLPESGLEDPDAPVDALIQRWQPPLAPEATASQAEPAPSEPLLARERLPEELAQDLTDFTLQFVRAVTKSSYYTADHQEAGKAKLGLYASFTTLVAERPEITFYSRKIGERGSVLVYGIFDEPTELAQAMLKGTSEIYIPKLSHYFEANGLLSISFKRALGEEEFHQFVDLLASPASAAAGGTNRIVHRLAENRIHNISVVVVEDRIGGRGLSWRVEMALTRLKKDLALTRLKKDLSVIPLYEHLSEEELRRVRLQVFRDVVRPLRQVALLRELLENCERVIEEVEEFSEDQLAEIETQLLASVPEGLLPALLEGLVDDVAEAKRESQEQMDRLLGLTRRVALQLGHEHAKNLVDAFRVLLKDEVVSLDELPPFLQRKFTAERDADRFLKLEARILARFGRESVPEKYRKYMDFFEFIFPELLSRADPSPTIAIVEHVSKHRLSPLPFEQRPEWAATWLEQIVYSSLSEDLVRELSQADKLKRGALLELCRRLGDETVPILFRALSRCEDVPTRQALGEVLAELKYASRAFLRSEFAQPDLPVDYLLELLRILGRVGDTRSTQLAAPLLGHEAPAVRIEALSTARALDAAFGEARTLAALSDADPRVQRAALKALFDAGSTAPALFAFCERILGGLNESNEETARTICSRLAGYGEGEARQRCVALLRMALGETQEKGGGWLSLLKRSVAGEPSHAAVRVAACQALGRLGATEASEALAHLAKQATPALKRAALHALERIRKS